jgi:hypothetical protein
VTAFIRAFVFCDSCQEPMDNSTVPSARNVSEARRDAKQRGWSRKRNGRDLCEGCAASVPGPLVPAQPGSDTNTRIVGYRSRDGRALYCTRHTGEIFGFGWWPVDSDDLPDGGICTYPDCGADVVIPQQPKEA